VTNKPFPWSLFLSEVVGTGLLVLGGLSCVILMFGEGSPLPRLLPDAGVRSALTGFLFGTTDCAGPPVGTFAAALLFSRLARRIEVAKLYHFDSAHDRLARRAGRGLVAMVVVLLATAPLVTAQEPSTDKPRSDDVLTRSTLTGDWGGGRTWLEERGVTVKPRLTQFYQGLTSGEGDHGAEYGGKADLLLNADLDKLGLWKGLSFSVHAEYNFGKAVNLDGGTLMPVNTALMFPGLKGPDAFDLTNVVFKQTFSNRASLMIGKISIVDYCDRKPFHGGVGVDAFWNIVFVAPPSGTVPVAFLGAILSVPTRAATYGVWFYDPNSSLNKSALDHAFADGFTIRGSVSFPVTMGGLTGHQGLAVSYSNKPGTDLDTLDGIPIPPSPSTPKKDQRYYFAYTIDQFLYQSKTNPKEGVGLFGQFEVSDGNPNPLKWMAFGGIGGTGLIPGRSHDNWAVGYYYAAPSKYLQDVPAPYPALCHEQALEAFYNFALTPWLVLGADLQIVSPSRVSDTAVFPGLRLVIRL
jgi:porin